jgi:hypothetical protein
MASRKRPFTDRLFKPIDPADAKTRGIGAAFALPASLDDLLAHIQDELDARWADLDHLFVLDSGAADIWEQRGKALVRHEFGIEPSDPLWWGRFTIHMCYLHVPGLKVAIRKKSGAPIEWTWTRLAQLFADIAYLKMTRRISVSQICKRLPKNKAYKAYWERCGEYSEQALRKAYSVAKKCRRNLLFELELCGGDALIPANGIDRIEAAIERHALKI